MKSFPQWVSCPPATTHGFYSIKDCIPCAVLYTPMAFFYTELSAGSAWQKHGPCPQGWAPWLLEFSLVPGYSLISLTLDLRSVCLSTATKISFSISHRFWGKRRQTYLLKLERFPFSLESQRLSLGNSTAMPLRYLDRIHFQQGLHRW